MDLLYCQMNFAAPQQSSTWLLAYSAYSPELSLPVRPSLLLVSLFLPPVMFRMHLRHDVITLIRLMLTNNTNAPIANRIRPPTMTPICAEKESITTKKGYLILDHAVMTGTFTFKATFKQRFSLFCYSNVKWTARCPIKERLYINVMMMIDWVLDS